MITWLRYQELRAAGPEITAEDHARLEKWRPRRDPVYVAVAMAFKPEAA